MKTPDQIAREALGADALNGIGYEKYLPYMVRAIEADRAQRSGMAAFGEFVYDHLAGETFTATEGAAIDIDGERWDYIDGEWTSEAWGALPLNQPIESYDFNIIHKGA